MKALDTGLVLAALMLVIAAIAGSILPVIGAFFFMACGVVTQHLVDTGVIKDVPK